MDVLVIAEKRIGNLLNDVLRVEGAGNAIPAVCVKHACDALASHRSGPVILNLSEEDNREFVCYLECLGIRSDYKVIVMDLKYNAEHQRKKLHADACLVQPFKPREVIEVLCS